LASSVTTIQITKDTREQLKELGRKGETYDQLINRLVKLAKRTEFFDEIDRIIETEEFVSIDEL
jgi:predicted CopG family antitoxin